MRIIPFIIVLMLFSFTAFADGIGNIKKVEGEITISRKGTVIIPKIGEKLYEGDIIKTGVDGSAGIIFNDSTRFALGANSEIFVNKYLFEPKKKEYSFKLRMNKGTGIYTSGRLGKLSPESVKIETPKATVGIRGTKFLIKVD